MKKEIIKILREYALSKGATNIKIISTGSISINRFVRLKCQYGCAGYARYFTCPPYSPTPDQTYNILVKYKNALLFEYPGKNSNIHETMFELERLAFLGGYYKAFAYAGGPCRLCPQGCPASEIENPNEFSKRLCRNPSKARPAMESAGIDVFKTVRSAGWEINVVQGTEDDYKRFGLLLLD